MLGVGLAMDAFSVSIANGLADKDMNASKISAIAGTFAAFQFAMPMIGWALVHTAASKLAWFEKLVPWIALALLGYIGIKMIRDGLKERAGRAEDISTGPGISGLMVQGIATSIDALSVGFTNSKYPAAEALISALIIGAVTFLICSVGCIAGRRAGKSLSWKAPILGGIILIAIGIKIWISGVGINI